MKKLILLSTIFSLFATKLLAQEPSANSESNTEPTIQEPSNSTKPKKARREERYENASPEQKEKMDKHRKMMRSLAPEKRELVKKEMERHRAEMKRITGFDLPSPENQNGPMDKPE